MIRPSKRSPSDLRKIELVPHAAKYAEGSCLAKFGDTHVLCAATIEEKVPPFLKNTGMGWVTAEYGMLPRATLERTEREAAKGKQSGRTQEIQRLIGRALRAVVRREILGEMQIRIDCDVLQADGGTRTAAITGGYVALALALRVLEKRGALKRGNPLAEGVAAVSCGIYQGACVLDLDYAEDSTAEADANFVMTSSGGLVEVQGSAEGKPFSKAQFDELLGLAEAGIRQLLEKQKEVLG